VRMHRARDSGRNRPAIGNARNKRRFSFKQLHGRVIASRWSKIP